MINHIPIRPDDGYTAGNTLHVRRVIGIVKAIWSRHRALCGVVRQQQGQSHFRMCFLCFDDRSGRQSVKASIVSNDELRDVKFYDVLFNTIPNNFKELS